MKKVMIVDDDRHISELLRLYLEAEGFEVISFETGEGALDSYEQEAPDAILLDVMLPGINGFDVVRSIRHRSSVPILMLTAKGDTTDTVVGLQVGADDYIEKPFEPKELIARVQAVIRRAQGRLSPEKDMYLGLQGFDPSAGAKFVEKSDRMQDSIAKKSQEKAVNQSGIGRDEAAKVFGTDSSDSSRSSMNADEENDENKPKASKDEKIQSLVIRGNLKVDINSYIACLDGKVIDMPPKELELLYFLAKHPNVVFTRDELLEKVWTKSADAGSRTIDVHIKRIREKFPDDSHPTWGISTVWGRGYIFKTEDMSDLMEHTD